jgi:hypothetical protein
MNLANLAISKYFLVFFISFAILIGSGYNMYLSYERFYNPDSETYMNIAKGNFTNQSLVRKYRVIVPTLAYIVSIPTSKVYYKIVSDKRQTYDWPLLTGFFLINTFLLAFAAMFIYKIMVFMKVSELASVIGLIAFLAGGRWASYVAAHPATDSLTILAISIMVYGILKEDKLLIGSSILLGVLSKESFVLFFPLLILFSTKPIRLYTFISIVFSMLCYFVVKYIIDKHSGSLPNESISVDINHINSIKTSLVKLFSLKGFADLFSVYGFFTFFFIASLFYKAKSSKIKLFISPLFIVFSVTILAHMLLSEELARMFYLGSAMFIPFLAVCIDSFSFFEKNKGSKRIIIL